MTEPDVREQKKKQKEYKGNYDKENELVKLHTLNHTA